MQTNLNSKLKTNGKGLSCDKFSGHVQNGARISGNKEMSPKKNQHTHSHNLHKNLGGSFIMAQQQSQKCKQAKTELEAAM